MDICLTSASRTGYSDDLCRVLAAPDGFEVQFRYDKKWIASTALNDKSPREALICFIDQTGGGTPTLLPLRHATITRVRISKFNLVISLRLGSFAPVENVSAFNSELRKKHNNVPDFKNGNIAGDYWFTVDQLSVGEENGYAGWESVVSGYYSLPNPDKDTPLYFMDGIRNLTTGCWVNPTSKLGILNYTLDSQNDYELIINHYHPSTDFPDISIGVSCSSDFFWITSPEKALDTRYDEKRFKFRPHGGLSAVDGTLSVFRQPSEPNSRHDDLTMTYHVKARNASRLKYILASGVAAALPGFFIASRFPDQVSYSEAGFLGFVAGAFLAIANLYKDGMK